MCEIQPFSQEAPAGARIPAPPRALCPRRPWAWPASPSPPHPPTVYVAFMPSAEGLRPGLWPAVLARTAHPPPLPGALALESSSAHGGGRGEQYKPPPVPVAGQPQRNRVWPLSPHNLLVPGTSCQRAQLRDTVVLPPAGGETAEYASLSPGTGAGPAPRPRLLTHTQSLQGPGLSCLYPAGGRCPAPGGRCP